MILISIEEQNIISHDCALHVVIIGSMLVLSRQGITTTTSYLEMMFLDTSPTQEVLNCRYLFESKFVFIQPPMKQIEWNVFTQPRQIFPIIRTFTPSKTQIKLWIIFLFKTRSCTKLPFFMIRCWPWYWWNVLLGETRGRCMIKIKNTTFFCAIVCYENCDSYLINYMFMTLFQ